MLGERTATRVCTRCVMDTSDPDITFDVRGACSNCARYDVMAATLRPAGGPAALEALAARIRTEGAKRDYDCVLGLSGGVDSSYVAYQAKQLGLRPLAVHLDNGWNSELAVQNIQHIVSRLGFDLVTHVVDWEEFRDLQLAFLRAGVVDIELLTDHAIIAVTHRMARQERVGYILDGLNVATEAIMPRAWNHRKSDLRNLRAIQRRFGTVPIRTLPTASSLRLAWWQQVRRVRSVHVLDYLDYDKDAAMRTLESELGWRYYGGKHFESLFTRFYQAHLLPAKFGIDKRRAHLSTLICSGQMTRDEALAELDRELYAPGDLADDLAYVCKKWGITEAELDAILREPPQSHFDYPSDEPYVRPLLKLRDRLQRPS